MRISDWSSDVCSSDLATSSGFWPPVAPRSLPSTPWDVPSRCLRKYSWPLPEEPSRFDRQTNRLRGQLAGRSEEHTSELQSLMRISYAVFCLKKKKNNKSPTNKQPMQYHAYKSEQRNRYIKQHRYDV